MTPDKVIESYVSWIKDNTFIKKLDDSTVFALSTPFLDSHNDHIDIYVKQIDGNKIILSDDGNTVADLRLGGTDISTTKRKAIFDSIVNGFGVGLGNDGELYIEANPSTLPQKKHSLIQSILAVNDMFMMSVENVASLFKEDVAAFFVEKDVPAVPSVKLQGKSGFDHNIDFVIPKGRSNSEKLIKTINRVRKDQLTPVMFAFDDIYKQRGEDTKNFVIYNDEIEEISSDSLHALDAYGISSIPWSHRDTELLELVAR